MFLPSVFRFIARKDSEIFISRSPWHFLDTATTPNVIIRNCHFNDGNETLSLTRRNASADNELIVLIVCAGNSYLKTVAKYFLAVSIFESTMKFIAIIFALILIIVSALAADIEVSKCQDFCGDEFDEVICASNGEETMNFMGRCRMLQYNTCYDERKTNLKLRFADIFEISFRFRWNWRVKVQTELSSSSHQRFPRQFLETKIRPSKMTKSFVKPSVQLVFRMLIEFPVPILLNIWINLKLIRKNFK